jgi:hypothetical protein
VHYLGDIMKEYSIVYVYLCVLCDAPPYMLLICIVTNPSGRKISIKINPGYMSFKVYVTITNVKG